MGPISTKLSGERSTVPSNPRSQLSQPTCPPTPTHTWHQRLSYTHSSLILVNTLSGSLPPRLKPTPRQLGTPLRSSTMRKLRLERDRMQLRPRPTLNWPPSKPSKVHSVHLLLLPELVQYSQQQRPRKSSPLRLSLMPTA